MTIGDEVYVHGYVDEIRQDVVIIRNNGGYFGTIPEEVLLTGIEYLADRKTEPQTDYHKLINEVVKLDMSREDKFKVIELLERHCEKCLAEKDEPQTERSE